MIILSNNVKFENFENVVIKKILNHEHKVAVKQNVIYSYILFTEEAQVCH